MLHGDLDKPVSLEQSELLKQLLDKYGVENQLFVEQGVGHSAPVFDTEKYVSEVFYFVRAHCPPQTFEKLSMCAIHYFSHINQFHLWQSYQNFAFSVTFPKLSIYHPPRYKSEVINTTDFYFFFDIELVHQKYKPKCAYELFWERLQAVQNN